MLIDAKRPPSPFPKIPLVLTITAVFLAAAPFITFVLLVLKGLPEFATSHQEEVLIWVYTVSWKPALLAGFLLGGFVVTLLSKTRSFHQPFDLGRSLSLGAVGGALTEALATELYRLLSHRLFSGFWIAGAMIAGCLAGAFIVAAVLWRLSKALNNRSV